MYTFQFLTLILTCLLLTRLTRANAESGAKDFLKLIKTYKEVCRALELKGNTCNCKGQERAIISFHARIASELSNLGYNAVVVFRKVTENSGSAYDGKTGKFTAPRDGIYSFTWTILTHPGKRFNTNVVLNDNSNIIGYNFADGKNGSNTYSSGSATAIIKMKKNDKVWIKTNGNDGEYVYAYWSSFSGFKL